MAYPHYPNKSVSYNFVLNNDSEISLEKIFKDKMRVKLVADTRVGEMFNIDVSLEPLPLESKKATLKDMDEVLELIEFITQAYGEMISAMLQNISSKGYMLNVKWKNIKIIDTEYLELEHLTTL